MTTNDEELTDRDIGIIDAIKTVMEVLLALGVPASVLAEPLEFQRNAHRSAGRTNAAVVLDILRDFVLDPERERKRQVVRLLQKEPPAGSA